MAQAAPPAADGAGSRATASPHLPRGQARRREALLPAPCFILLDSNELALNRFARRPEDMGR